MSLLTVHLQDLLLRSPPSWGRMCSGLEAEAAQRTLLLLSVRGRVPVVTAALTHSQLRQQDGEGGADASAGFAGAARWSHSLQVRRVPETLVFQPWTNSSKVESVEMSRRSQQQRHGDLLI